MSRHNNSFVPPNLAPIPYQLQKTVGSATVTVHTFPPPKHTSHTSTQLSCPTFKPDEHSTNDNSSDDMNFSFDYEQLDDILEIAKSCL